LDPRSPPASGAGAGPPRAGLVLGTAGHIDHGKTALIGALTGVDTDRLPEEKARGITIGLGFAPLELAGGLRAGVVDVPGHERLVRTMVAGATGIDLVLLVVAADEGVMPQTREHVAICELLGIARGVVALTKIDVASDDVAELAAEEVAELLAGSGLAGAPIVPVSAVTGAGLDELRKELADAIASADPRTPRTGPPRLHVDRGFAAKGFGSVVTGTLVGAPLAVADAVEVYPSGRRGRVRGLQSHGVAAQRVEPGARCAVNLQNVELEQLGRGQVISTPESIAPTRTADASLWWLAAAPEAKGPTAVEFLAGTAERRARAAPIGADRFRPGARGYARLHIDGEPVPLLPGDRFILRGFARTEAGGSTLGGGVILDVAPPHRRRSDPALLRDLELLARRDPATDLCVRIRRSGLTGMGEDRLRRETGLAGEVLAATLRELARDGSAAATPAGTWLQGAALADLEGRLLRALDAYHQAEPIRPGMPRGALRGRLPENVARDAAETAIEGLAARGAVTVEGDLVRRSGHRPRLGAEDRALVERLVEQAQAAGLEPPSLRDWAERLGVNAERLRDLLAHLEREARLVRTRGDLWFDRAAVDALRERVVAHLRAHGQLETQAYKALIGTTRRTAVPLMEFFDAEHLTIRSGAVRKLRAGGEG
jgi:selenocysteine-specific elongation factor